MEKLALDNAFKMAVKKAVICPDCRMLMPDTLRRRSLSPLVCACPGACRNSNAYESLRIPRNSPLERLVMNTLFPCTHQSLGCRVMLKLEDLAFHECNCDYMSRLCPMGPDTCRWKGIFQELERHCRKVHSDRCLESSYGREVNYLAHQRDNAISSIIFTCGSMFVCTWKSFTAEYVRVAVAHLGQDYPNKIFKYAVYVINKGVSVAKYDGFCYQSPSNQPSSHDVPLQFLAKNCDKDGCLIFRVQISRWTH